MKSSSTLVVSVLSAQLMSSLAAEVAEVPQVKVTEIDPAHAKGALNRLVADKTFTVVSNQQAEEGKTKPKPKPKRASGKNRDRALKSSKKGSGTGQGNSPQNRGSSGRMGPQTGTATAHKASTARDGGGGLPPHSTGRQHDESSDEIGDDTAYYDDYYYDDYYHYDDDDYYYSKGKGKGKGGKGKGGKGYYDDDYYFVGPGKGGDIIDGEEELFLEAFQDSRFLDPPILVEGNSTEFAPGTVYLFNDAPLHHLDFVDSGSLVGIVQGTCTRTDASDPAFFDFTGEAVCQFTYEILDGSHVVASFVAEGAVDNSIDGSVLTITGGLGELEGVTGIVTLQTAFLDTSVVPPLVLRDGTVDFLTPIDGYYMTAELYVTMEVSFPTDMIPDDDVMPPGSVPPGSVPPGTVPPGTIPPGTVPPTVIVEPEPPSMLPSTMLADPLDVGDNGHHRIVQCPGQAQEDYCDCLADSDCAHFAHSRCSCGQARAPSCCDSS